MDHTSHSSSLPWFWPRAAPFSPNHVQECSHWAVQVQSTRFWGSFFHLLTWIPMLRWSYRVFFPDFPVTRTWLQEQQMGSAELQVQSGRLCKLSVFISLKYMGCIFTSLSKFFFHNWQTLFTYSTMLKSSVSVPSLLDMKDWSFVLFLFPVCMLLFKI